MKRIFSMIMATALMCSMMVTGASAATGNSKTYTSTDGLKSITFSHVISEEPKTIRRVSGVDGWHEMTITLVIVARDSDVTVTSPEGDTLTRGLDVIFDYNDEGIYVPGMSTGNFTTGKSVSPLIDGGENYLQSIDMNSGIWYRFAREHELTAAPAASKVLVNGKNTAFDAYTINGNNYFKIRDIASVLNGTGKQFDVIWDKNLNAVNMTSNHSYTAVGGEMAKGDGASKTATVNTAKIYMDGKEVSLMAYTINGNNYVKLRDLGQLFNFGVRWENAVVIDTNTGYTAEFTDANAGQGVDLSDTDTNPYPKGE